MQEESDLTQVTHIEEGEEQVPPPAEGLLAEEPAIEAASKAPEPEIENEPEVPEFEVESEFEPAGESVAEAGPDVEPAPEPELAIPAQTEPAPEGEIVAEPLAVRVPWWPFLLLAVLWVAVSSAAAYLLTRVSDVPAYQQEWYPAIVLAGVVLTCLGPVVAGVTWATIRGDAATHERGGLLVGSLLRAAAITLIGVLAWWGTLVAVDALRLGLIKI